MRRTLNADGGRADAGDRLPLLGIAGLGPAHAAGARHWFEDGPLVRAEFLRESSDGRITLVLHESVQTPVRALWTVMDAADIDTALLALGKRKGMGEKKSRTHIGVWEHDRKEPSEIFGLPAWAQARSIDAVIWTALPPQFDGEEGKVVDAVEWKGLKDRLLAATEGNRQNYYWHGQRCMTDQRFVQLCVPQAAVIGNVPAVVSRLYAPVHRLFDPRFEISPRFISAMMPQFIAPGL